MPVAADRVISAKDACASAVVNRPMGRSSISASAPGMLSGRQRFEQCFWVAA